MAEKELWYYIDGSSDVLCVSVSLNDTIHTLKRKIHDDDPQYPISSLILTQVDEDLNTISEAIHAGQRQLYTTNKSLRNIQKISSVWPELPREGRLHLSVKVDPTALSGGSASKRRRLTTESDFLKGPDDNYLMEMQQFWRSLWHDKQDPFDNVSVNRDSVPIDDVDVPETMKVLHLPTALSTLAKVMIRSEYDNAIRDLNSTDFAGGYKSVIVVGHPGIGKTILLYYILVRRLLEQKPTILQRRSQYLYFFNSKGVEVLLPSDPVVSGKYQNSWALVDINVDVQLPAAIIGDDNFPAFRVIASSPRASRLQDLKKYGIPGTYWFMEPFTLPELIQARQLQSDSEVNSESDIQKFFANYGPSARDCYRSCKPNVLKTYVGDVRGKLDAMSWDLIATILTSHPADAKMEEGSHKVLLVEPQPDDRSRARTTVISRTISQLLWERDTDEQWRNHNKLFKTLNRVPEAKGLSGNLFEPAFHAMCIRNTVTRLRIYPMVSNSGGRINYTFTVPKSESESNSLELELGQRSLFSFDNDDKEDTAIRTLHAEYYYRPTAKNYPSLDSFIYDPVSQQINLFQTTVAKKHNLLSGGVMAVHELGLRLNINLKIRIIVVLFGKVQIEYVISKDLYEEWGLQAYVVQVTEDQLYRI